jgi:hypothetical protein
MALAVYDSYIIPCLCRAGKNTSRRERGGAEEERSEYALSMWDSVFKTFCTIKSPPCALVMATVACPYSFQTRVCSGIRSWR